MKSVVDTIFAPILGWLDNIINAILKLTVPVSRPINPNSFFKSIAMIGHGWTLFVSTACILAATYCILFVVVASKNLVIDFKRIVKWW
ncbi:hypothetical protein P9027_31440 [Bacillus thuringiensis]|uniref:hypothetical protein n=1 Tax=Bacillus cereus group TaxID=86661 RepID=UPI000BFB9288|nr:MULTISPECIES: hypothetical protein [Bacillus cereus group]MCU4936939.1 hypothetical protein [Bacillus cereus]MEC3226419.1 hypothetical protein [Bacillus thuringiensis]MEC3463156.1 hypothetical protein [Bacillus thuringiensis]MEC3553561.1 hypothetical protein [Bacillus thuringiensis]MED2059984.1 hypothetical protein [Bacillus thuringiensis]